jgi:hypothetical protein
MTIYEHLEAVAAASGRTMSEVLDADFAAGMEIESRCIAAGPDTLTSLHVLRRFRQRSLQKAATNA